MRILFVASGSEGVGTYFRIFFLAKYLVKRGHQVTIVCANSTSSMKPFQIKERDGVKIINLLKTSFKWDYPGYILRTFLTPALTISNSYEVLHSFVVSQPPSCAALLTAKLLGALRLKKALIVADWDDWWGRNGIGKAHGAIVHAGLTFLEEKTPRFADAVVVVSGKLKEKALEIGIRPDRVFTVPNGASVDTIKPMPMHDSRVRLGISDRKFVLVYVGHFHTPCVSMMLAAFKQIVKKRSDAVLLIVGNVPVEYKELIQKDNGLKERVILAGKQPYQDMSLYLAAADVLLMPMENTIVEEARFPIRFGDYLASGRPMVASAIGEVKNIIEKEGCGILAKPDDPGDFADKIMLLLNNRKLREDIGLKARKLAEESYSWEKLAADLEEIYIDLLKKKKIV